MIEYIKARLFQAKVQAELMAQCKDQQFVNEVCHPIKYIDLVNTLRRVAYYKGTKIAPFLTVCAVLGEAINDTELPFHTRFLCAAHLHNRLEKSASNPQFRVQHLLLIGELEDKMSSWTKKNRAAIDVMAAATS